MRIDKTKTDLIIAKSGLKYKEIAERANMSRQSLSTMLCRGTATPPTLGKLAKALGVDPAELIKQEE